MNDNQVYEDPWNGIQDPFADVPLPTEEPWDPWDPAMKTAAAQPADDGLDEHIKIMIKPGSSILDAPAQIPAVWGHDDDVLWASGEAMMISGPAGVGKTTLVGQVVKARLGLGTGKVLGFPVQPGAKKVLYLAMDRPRQITRSLARQFSEEDRAVLEEKLVLWSGPPLVDMARDDRLLLRMCQLADADTVIVDSLKDAAIGLSEDAVGAGYNRARQAAIAGGIEIIELHHQTKSGDNGGQPTGLKHVYGSTWITAGAGSVIGIWGNAGDPIVELRHLKQPANEVGPWKIIHDPKTGTSSIFEGVDLLTVVRANGQGVSARLAAVKVFDAEAPTTAQVEKARRKLNDLVEQNLARMVQGKRGGTETRWFAVVDRSDEPLDLDL